MILWKTCFKKSIYDFNRQQFESMDSLKLNNIFNEMHDNINDLPWSPRTTPLSIKSAITPNQHVADKDFPKFPLNPLSCHTSFPPTIPELSPGAPAHIRAIFDNCIFTSRHSTPIHQTICIPLIPINPEMNPPQLYLQLRPISLTIMYQNSHTTETTTTHRAPMPPSTINTDNTLTTTILPLK